MPMAEHLDERPGERIYEGRFTRDLINNQISVEI